MAAYDWFPNLGYSGILGTNIRGTQRGHVTSKLIYFKQHQNVGENPSN